MTYTQKLLLILQIGDLTQSELAQKLKVSFPTVNSWINGRSEPRRGAAERIDRLFRHYSGKAAIPDDLGVAKQNFLEKYHEQIKDPLSLLIKRVDLRQQFMLSLTFNSNRIEGNTLTEAETAAVIFNNRALPNRSLVEQLEARNHRIAFEFLLSHLSQKGPISEKFVLRLHQLIMSGIQGDAGEYRLHPVRIVGSYVPTANYLKVPKLMAKLIRGLKNPGKNFMVHIAKVHSDFEQVHPFSDGNGRVGRLLMTVMLLKSKFPPAIILAKERKRYLETLQDAQLNRRLEPLQDLVIDAVLRGYKTFNV